MTSAAQSFVAEGTYRAVGLYAGGYESMHFGVDTPMPVGSVIKIPLVIAALGLLNESHAVHGRASVEEIRQTRHASVLGAFAPRTKLSVTSIGGLSLVASDNDCASWLFERLPRGAVEEVCHELNLAQTRLEVSFRDNEFGAIGRANTMSIRDAVRLLRALHDDPRLNIVESMMRDSQHNERIPGFLYNTFPIAHKTGTLKGVACDIGLLHIPTGTVALAALTDHEVSTTATSTAIADLAYACASAFGPLKNKTAL